MRGDEAVVVLDADEYRRLARRPKGSLVDFFRKSPLVGVELDLARKPRHRKRRRALSFLLDTCVISELVKAEPNASVLAWL